MNKLISKKITFTSSTMMLIVVISHIGLKDSLDYSFLPKTFPEMIVNGMFSFFDMLAPNAVAVYFALSSYLFFRGKLSIKNSIRKVKKRFKTVFIPFVYWTLSFWIILKLLSLIPGIGSRINAPVSEFPMFFFDFSANEPLWFLLVLFELQLISIVILMIFKYMKKASIIPIILIIFMDVWFGYKYRTLLHWLGIYMLGGYFGYYFYQDIEKVSLKIINLKKVYKIFLIFLIVSISWAINKISLLYIFSPFFVYLLISMKKNIPYFDWMEYSFFIYCSHILLIKILRKIFYLLFGVSFRAMVISYILSVLLIPYILSICAKFIKQHYLYFYNIIVGNR